MWSLEFWVDIPKCSCDIFAAKDTCIFEKHPHGLGTSVDISGKPFAFGDVSLSGLDYTKVVKWKNYPNLTISYVRPVGKRTISNIYKYQHKSMLEI